MCGVRARRCIANSCSSTPLLRPTKLASAKERVRLFLFSSSFVFFFFVYFCSFRLCLRHPPYSHFRWSPTPSCASPPARPIIDTVSEKTSFGQLSVKRWPSVYFIRWYCCCCMGQSVCNAVVVLARQLANRKQWQLTGPDSALWNVNLLGSC